MTFAQCPECIRFVAGPMSLRIFLLFPSGALCWELGVPFTFLLNNSRHQPLRAPAPSCHPTKIASCDYVINSLTRAMRSVLRLLLFYNWRDIRGSTNSLTLSQKARALGRIHASSLLVLPDPGSLVPVGGLRPSTYLPTSLFTLTMPGPL